MQRSGKFSSTALFLRELVANPRQVGAVLPSSKKLGAAMARWVPKNPHAFVLELGPGTGVVTEALLENGLQPERLVAVEYSSRMADLLRKRFPGIRVITGDAFKVDELVRENGLDSKIEIVFSSLPLRNFGPEATENLARRIHSVLPPKGRLVQYSYHVWNHKSYADCCFKRFASDVIWFNVPPARVSVHQK